MLLILLLFRGCCIVRKAGVTTARILLINYTKVNRYTFKRSSATILPPFLVGVSLKEKEFAPLGANSYLYE